MNPEDQSNNPGSPQDNVPPAAGIPPTPPQDTSPLPVQPSSVVPPPVSEPMQPNSQGMPPAATTPNNRKMIGILVIIGGIIVLIVFGVLVIPSIF